jgi:hypothetical protein
MMSSEEMLKPDSKGNFCFLGDNQKIKTSLLQKWRMWMMTVFGYDWGVGK